ncbi:Uncharacterized protein dnm_052870 [Desulfonema magnum]|uniref:Uncharacterized protein n=1 Tax=Desulfonema magnum TaxID=45655 RepID=A0A975BPU7_9BACT|nr:Uncharacterized protein dnm_052870 [Desulfonema magnum]
MRDGCRTGFATPSETFAGGDPGKYSGRGCKPRPAKSELIKTVGCNLSLMHMRSSPGGTAYL